MPAVTKDAPLVSLGDTGLRPEDPIDDLRGRKVYDSKDEEIGTVDDLMVNRETREVSLLQVTGGGALGLGGTTFMIPVEAIDHVDADAVHLGHTRDQVAGAPVYSPHLVEDNDWDGPYWPALYTYYGGWPFWR